MIEKVLKLYLDTSVFGGFYDLEFEEETQILFEKINLGQFKVVFSDTTEEELLGAPQNVQALILS
jgi:hypothetical protein